MKFGAPLLTTELRGALGGVVGANARGGIGYFRARTRPGNPRSPFQATVRAILTGLSGAWTSILTGLQRAAWEGLAPSGSSGIDVYVKANAQRLLGGLAREDDAPPSLALGNLPYDDVANPWVADASAHTVTGALPAGETLTLSVNVYVSAPQKASRLSRQHNYTFANSVHGISGGDAVGGALPVNHPAYNMQTGDVVYVKFQPYGDSTDATVGTPQEFRVTVTA